MKAKGKISFDDNFPKEVAKGLPELFNSNAYVIPGWCNAVLVTWDSEPTDENGDLSSIPAYTETHYEYRHATVYICPTFLDQIPSEKDRIVKHELGHIITAPLVDYINQALELLELEENVNSLIMHGVQQNMEAVTEDLTHVLISKP